MEIDPAIVCPIGHECIGDCNRSHDLVVPGDSEPFAAIRPDSPDAPSITGHVVRRAVVAETALEISRLIPALLEVRGAMRPKALCIDGSVRKGIHQHDGAIGSHEGRLYEITSWNNLSSHREVCLPVTKESIGYCSRCSGFL